MRFLPSDSISKTILVISDLHLGAGPYIGNRRNHLEDFHHDKELVDFLDYYSSDNYEERPVELVINGDFFDLLAVPFVPFFDDEFWSEEAAQQKLEIIVKAHKEVIDSFIAFLNKPNKTIVYIIGNHDAELILPAVRSYFIGLLPDTLKERFQFRVDQEEYLPIEGVLIKHGHQYEVAHTYSLKKSIVESEDGRRFFVPPWGSYYVTRVVNKFKADRAFINAVKPVKTFMVYGIIYDTLFTARFMLATFIYFFMVRVIYFFRKGLNLRKIFEHMKRELQLFQDYETLTEDFIQEREDLRAFIVGHTHEPAIRNYANGQVFINTGTWTKMYYLDFTRRRDGFLLTYAQIDERLKSDNSKSFDHLSINLNIWKGRSSLPFKEYQ